jgi:hypothetical protein
VLAATFPHTQHTHSATPSNKDASILNHIVFFYAHSLPKVDSRLLLLPQPLAEADASHMRPSSTAATTKPH